MIGQVNVKGFKGSCECEETVEELKGVACFVKTTRKQHEYAGPKQTASANRVTSALLRKKGF